MAHTRKSPFIVRTLHKSQTPSPPSKPTSSPMVPKMLLVVALLACAAVTKAENRFFTMCLTLMLGALAFCVVTPCKCSETSFPD